VARALPAISTGVDKLEESETHLQKALMASMFGDDRRKIELEIPIPIVHEIPQEQRVHISLWSRPSSYIRSEKTDEELIKVTVDYEADHFDEKWVETLNQNPAYKYKVTLSEFEVLMDKLEKAQGFGTELLPYAVMKSHLGSISAENVRKEIYEYWLSRRKSKGKSFLRYFEPPPDVNDPNPAIAFRPVEKENNANRQRARSNTQDSYKKMLALRRDFEHLRTLLEQVSKRERLKKETALSQLAFCKKSSELAVMYPKLLNAIDPSRKKRRTVPGATPAAITDGVAGAAPPSGGPSGQTSPMADSERRRFPLGVDSLGFDETANRFFLHMRYFAGGFAGHGVSPYDHRVLTAASTRNTAVDPTCQMVDFPSKALDFARPVKQQRPGAGKWAPWLNNDQRAFDSRGDHVVTNPPNATGFVSENGFAKAGPSHSRPEIPSRASTRAEHSAPQDHMWTWPVSPGVSSSPTSSYTSGLDTGGIFRVPKRPIRVRPRLGRGGRIILDRVSATESLADKALNSYHSSTRAGGAYTGGVPLEKLDPSSPSRSVMSTFYGITYDDSAARLMHPRLLLDDEPGHIAAEDEAALSLMPHWPHRKGKLLLINPYSSLTFRNYDRGRLKTSMRNVRSPSKPNRKDISQSLQEDESKKYGEDILRSYVFEDRLKMRSIPGYAEESTPLVIFADDDMDS